MAKISYLNFNGIDFTITDGEAQIKLDALQKLYNKQNEPYLASIYNQPSIIKEQDIKEDIPADRLGEWLAGDKPNYSYFVFTATNPSLTLTTIFGNILHQNKVYVLDCLPNGIYDDWDEQGIITIYYGNYED